MKQEYYVRLPLKYACNVRDLGGYPLAGGLATKWRRFLRADDLCNLDQGDIDFLVGYGVRAVMDLRGADELQKNPSPFKGYPGVNYANVPLMGGNVADVTKLAGDRPAGFLPHFYMDLLQHSHAALKQVFDFFAGCQDGCVVFHCAAGKDRTGVTAMLLLGLCGVGKYDLIANYETTYANLRNNAAWLAGMGEYPREAVFSKAEYIEPAIDYIVGCGGFEAYLSATVGVSQIHLDRIKERLV